MRLRNGKISRIEILRGASCGATWEAAAKMLNLTPAQALDQMGLEVQFFCCADPSAWDPIHGKSPVHFAGKIHHIALQEALSDKSS